MAREVQCVCGRRFYIGQRSDSIQCRKCGRWWSGREIGGIEAIATVLLGGEIACADRRKGDRPRSRQRPHRGRQTNQRRPPSNPTGSVLRWLFGYWERRSMPRCRTLTA